MQRSLHLAHKFTRRVAFGLPHDAPLPDDSLAWAKAQLRRPPPIDILERDGSRRTDLPAWVHLLWRMDDVMYAFEKHRRLETESFDKAKRMSKEQYEAERKRDMSLSGILCLRHSMSKRSICANESKDRCGGHSGIAAHFV